MTRAFLLAPLVPLAIVFVWSAAHYPTPHWIYALVNPVVWLFVAAIGLPAFYVAELLFALPAHLLLQRAGKTTRFWYSASGAVVGAIAGWLWTNVVRMGPAPIHKDFQTLLPVLLVAGAIGGWTFWSVALRR